MLPLYLSGQVDLGSEDIRDIHDQRQRLWPIKWLVIGVGILLGVLIAIVALRKWRGKDPVPDEVGPPPELVAKTRLDDICEHVDGMKPNQASLETSETVKEFLSAQYDDPILYETAEEYLTRLSTPVEGDEARVEFSSQLTEEVRSFMSISQELKFAQIREAKKRIPALIDQAKKIIEMSVGETDADSDSG